MDVVSALTVIGIVCGVIFGLATLAVTFLAMEQARLRRRVEELEKKLADSEERNARLQRQLTDYLLLLTEAQLARHDAEQSLMNLRALRGKEGPEP